MKKPEQTSTSQAQAISLRAAARRAAVDGQVVQYCVEVGLVEKGLTEVDLRELRRVRRLMSLGVNLEGAEIILRMRHRIRELEAELARLRRLLY